MDVGLGIAGLLCVALALGHETIGQRWVLPGLSEQSVSATPFGSRSMTVSMVRVTWHIVTIFVLSLGALLIILAWEPAADARTVLLRTFAVMWLAATAMAWWIAGRKVRSLRGVMRLPVPLLWVVVAVLCWVAST